MEEVRRLFQKMFNLSEDQAPMDEIISRIKSGATVRGTNLCILILAMFIASIGLNMNSTAVIIGAMLISPLMGCIMGMAYGIASFDLRYARNIAFSFACEVIFCILTSTIYFTLTPIHGASSEILARTSPTVWDALIAIFGGLAGIIGTTRSEKSNIIPGVAIATALMPPLCTAGYGIAQRNPSYFIGALYLFFINTFFICLTSIIVLKIIHVPARQNISLAQKRFQRVIILIIGIVTIIPSIFLAYNTVNSSMLNSNFNNYITQEFTFDESSVVNSHIDTTNKEITIAMVGKVLDDETVTSLQEELSAYGLSGYTLRLTQTKLTAGVNKEDVQNLINSQLTDIETKDSETAANSEDTINSLKTRVAIYQTAYSTEMANELNLSVIQSQIHALYPNVMGFYGGSIGMADEDDNYYFDTFAAYLLVTEELTEDEQTQMISWLKQTTGYDKIALSTLVDPDATTSTWAPVKEEEENPSTVTVVAPGEGATTETSTGTTSQSAEGATQSTQSADDQTSTDSSEVGASTAE